MAYIGKSPAVAALTASDITDGIVSTAKIADNAVTEAKTAWNDVPFRNLVTNGDMQICQRGTSIASIATNTYTLDRWTTEGDDCTMTVTQDTSVPTAEGFTTSLKMDVTSANASLDAGDNVVLSQRFEGQMLQHLKKGTANAESLTCSFWVKNSITGTFIVMLQDDDNSRHISKSYTVSSADTWEQKEVTFAGDTTGAFGNDKNRSLRLQFFIDAGTDYTSGTLATSWASNTTANRAVGITTGWSTSTSNNFWLTGVQMEIGTLKSNFEFLPFDVSLKRCRRYCLMLGDALGGADYDTFLNGTIGHYYNTTDFYPNFSYPVVMRGTPDVSFSTTSSGFGTVYSNGSGRANTSVGTNATENTNINFRVSTGTATAGDGGAFNFTSGDYVLLSAEL